MKDNSESQAHIDFTGPPKKCRAPKELRMPIKINKNETNEKKTNKELKLFTIFVTNISKGF